MSIPKDGYLIANEIATSYLFEPNNMGFPLQRAIIQYRDLDFKKGELHFLVKSGYYDVEGDPVEEKEYSIEGELNEDNTITIMNNEGAVIRIFKTYPEIKEILRKECRS